VSIRGVLFDWDGTLVRGEPLAMANASESVAAYTRQDIAPKLTAGQFQRALEAVLPEYRPGTTETSPHINPLLDAAFACLGVTVSAGDIESCARLFFQEATRGVTVYDDARALLASLRYRGYRTAVVTNAIFPSALFEPRLKELGLAGYLDAVVSSADVGLAKPNPSLYFKALDALGLEPYEAIFVGDNVSTDIAGARAAGMPAVLIERIGRAHDGSGYLVIERLTALNDILGDGPVNG